MRSDSLVGVQRLERCVDSSNTLAIGRQLFRYADRSLNRGCFSSSNGLSKLRPAQAALHRSRVPSVSSSENFNKLFLELIVLLINGMKYPD